MARAPVLPEVAHRGRRKLLRSRVLRRPRTPIQRVVPPRRAGPVGLGASHWEVVDGAISPCSDIAGYLIPKENYKDLVLTCDFRTGEDTNTGVFVRGLGRSLVSTDGLQQPEPEEFLADTDDAPTRIL